MQSYCGCSSGKPTILQARKKASIEAARKYGDRVSFILAVLTFAPAQYVSTFGQKLMVKFQRPLKSLLRYRGWA